VAQPWDVAAVPRGAIHRHFFRSSVVGDDRDFYVYTPPGYDEARERSYPVLYLLHGFSDDASAWTAVGRTHVVLDNLIAQKRAEPMIVVMPFGYGAPEILDGGFSGFARDPQLLERNLDRFRESLVSEVMPRAEAAYRIAGARATRAIAGLSMGGAEALRTGLNRLDLFAWIGAFSSGGLSTQLGHDFEGLARANDAPSLVWISCGTDDALLPITRSVDAWLREKNVAHTAREVPGGHVWGVWRRDLVEFAPLLFRTAPSAAK
jgi:enterochelin esterase family protein